jgi:hypothetical protein
VEIISTISKIMFSGFWPFVGCFFVLLLIADLIEKLWGKLFDFLITLVKRGEKNNFYVSAKNIDSKFLEELKKHGDKKRAER